MSPRLLRLSGTRLRAGGSVSGERSPGPGALSVEAFLKKADKTNGGFFFIIFSD